MPHSMSLITTIAAALGLAFALGFGAARFKLPPLVGYLLAGIILGPATPGFVADMELAGQLAEIGVMLLMFGVGLHFSLEDLLTVSKVAVPGAIVQIIVATMLGMGLSTIWGWGWGSGLVFGLTLSVASTVVLLRALEDRGILESINGRIAVGWLVVEDLVTIIALVLLPPLSVWLGGQPTSPVDGVETKSLWVTLALVLGQVTVFVALMLVVGKRAFPWFLWQVARTGSRELFTLSVVAAAVVIAYAASALFGVSFALGAFFAGMVLRESELSHRAAEESLPLRDAFSVLFFVSVGMLFDPQVLVDHPLEVLGVLAIILIGKSLAAFVLVLILRYSLNTALTVSASLAQIGEFSFILAALGVSLGLLSPQAQSLILAGAIISIAVNPLVFKVNDLILAWLRSFPYLAGFVSQRDDPLTELSLSEDQSNLAEQVILVGYGRVGRRIAEIFNQSTLPYIVVEQNRKLVEQLRQNNMPAVAGDASEPATLIQAHVTQAKVLVIATPDTFQVRQIVEIAHALNPTIETIIRTHNEEEALLFEKENIGKVFIGEQELARGIAQYILEKLSKKSKKTKSAKRYIPNKQK